MQSLPSGQNYHVSPIHHLPAEILQSIFSYSIPVSPNCDSWDTRSEWWNNPGHRFLSDLQHPNLGYGVPNYVVSFPGHDSRQAPWSISSVCKQWRFVALATPKLWSYIQVSYILETEDESDDSLDNMVRRLSLSLERSRPFGLDIVLGILETNTYVCDTNALPENIVDVLLQHKDRWERIYSSNVSFGWDSSPRISYYPFSAHNRRNINSLEERTLPRLKALTVRRISDILPPRFHAPGLKTISRLLELDRSTIRQDAGETLAHHYSLPFRTAVPQTLSILNRMKHLTTLRLSFEAPEIFGAPSWSLELDLGICITLPSVTTLTLGMLPHHTSEHILRSMTLPALQRLYLLSVYNSSTIPSLLDRSACRLSSLRINEAGLDSQEVFSTLVRTPDLEDFHISFLQTPPPSIWRDPEQIGLMNDTLLEYLLDPVKAICPKLRNLSLLWIRRLNVSLVMDLLKMRLAPDVISKLEMLEIGIIGYEGDETVLTDEYKDIVHELRIRHRLRVELKESGLLFDLDDSLEDSDSLIGSLPFSDESTSESEQSFIGDEVDWEEDFEALTARLQDLDEGDDDVDSDYVPPSSAQSCVCHFL